MAINTPIPSMETDWHGYSGEQVQAFIKRMIQQSFSNISEKIGFVAYSDGDLIFYDEMNGTELSRVSLTGTSYSIKINATPSTQTFTVLTTEKEHFITLSPETVAYTLGATESQPYYEDYGVRIERQSSGNWDTVYEGSITSGTTASIDVRKFLLSTNTVIRVVVTGASSGQQTSHRYAITLTDMNLVCRHTWQTPWIEGQNYQINNINIFGNLQKTVYIKVGDVETIVSRAYSPTEEYKTSTTSIDIALEDILPFLSTGIIPIDMWMESSEGLSTEHIKFNIMYIGAVDVGNVSLVCVNNKLDTVTNFKQETLLQYAVYNITTISETATATNGTITNTISDITRTVGGGQVYDVTLDLKIDLDGTSTSIYTLALRIGDSYNEFKVDNSLAFFAFGGYRLYINTSTNANDSSSKKVIYNSSSKPGDYYAASYSGTWNNFTFADDAWGKDIDGNSALVVKAGSELKVPTLKPFKDGKERTIEFMFRASNISDYDTPILTCMNTETYDPAVTKGLVVFPTKILLMQTGSESTASIYQQLPLSEDRIHHIAIVEDRDYGEVGSALNLVTIYINGNANVTFSIGGTSSFYDSSAPDYGYLRIGQPSTDTYLYMMRAYDQALSSDDIFKNYLNALIATATERTELRDKNDVGTGGIDYTKCKELGLNCFVVQTKNDSEIPNVINGNEFSDGVTIRLEYGEHPEWNVTIQNTALDSQGTTSSKYYRHNLRSKVPKTAEWSYPNNPNLATTTGKEGYFDGEGNHPMVSKITWKKNIASQPQGHKMGATGLYNDLYKLVMSDYGDIVEEGILPREDARVAVYQHPFVGFHYRTSTGKYEFIGMYTGGPDKTDKKTFGYNETEAFPSLMMIEGPDHTPLLTRFIVPWTSSVFYDASEESLSVGSEKGWDADIVADYDTKTQPDEIMAMYRSEFKPAYDAIWRYSPYIAYIVESGLSLAAINADIYTFWASTSSHYEHRNALMTFWQYNETDATKIDLVYYDAASRQYKVMPYTEYDMVEDLGLIYNEGGYTTEQILAVRQAVWKERVGEYVNLNEACFRQCFDEFIGASDNDAKNSYWRKFKSVADGGKWGFQEDDLDTIFQTDNNGQDTKAYYIEPNDVTSIGNDIFQGRTSAFWYALRIWCQDDLQLMMQKIVDKAIVLADSLGMPKTNVHTTMFNVIDHYFWKHSAKYFPTAVYNADTKWAYVDIWYDNPTGEYNNVPPLTQVHGDHYETERDWVEKRIAYMFSKYQCGGYRHTDSADGYNILAMTPLQPFTFNVTPAIWQYPRGGVGDTTTQGSERTKAGEVYPLTLEGSADGSTTNYVMAIDWMSDLGDLKDLKLAARGGEGAQISFAINSNRIKRLKIGDADSTPLFNANAVAINGNCFETFDARNVSTLGGDLSFTKTPRMREIYLSGTNVTNVILPNGGREEIIEMPDTIKTLVLPNINLLKADGLILSDTAKANLTQIYLENCDNINPIDFLASLLNLSNNSLTHIGLVWRGTTTTSDYAVIRLLLSIANKAGTDGGYGGIEYNNGATSTTKMPNIKGTLRYTGARAYKSEIDVIKAKLPSLTLTVPSNVTYYVEFEDDVVRQYIAETYGTAYNGVKYGITTSQRDAIKTMPNLNSLAGAVTFNELRDFIGIKGTYANPVAIQGGVSSIKQLMLPQNLEYFARATSGVMPLQKMTGITHLGFPNKSQWVRYYGDNEDAVFGNKTSLKYLYFPSGESVFKQSWGTDCYPAQGNKSGMMYYRTGVPKHAAALITLTCHETSLVERILYKAAIQTLVIGPETTSIELSACMYSSIKKIEGGENVTSIGASAFYNCVSLTSVTIPDSVTSIGASAFGACYGLQYVICNAEQVPSLGSGAFTSNKDYPIFVPDASVGDYRGAANWSTYAARIYPLSEFNEANYQ